jgi:hypothetical protein
MKKYVDFEFWVLSRVLSRITRTKLWSFWPFFMARA